jgi:hypothetical protein
MCQALGSGSRGFRLLFFSALVLGLATLRLRFGATGPCIVGVGVRVLGRLKRSKNGVEPTLEMIQIGLEGCGGLFAPARTCQMVGWGEKTLLEKTPGRKAMVKSMQKQYGH